MTSLQDKRAALKAGDYDVVLGGTEYEEKGSSIQCQIGNDYMTGGEYNQRMDAKQNAAKVIVLEEHVRVLREALEECWHRINVGVEYEEAGLQPDSYAYTYGGVKDKVITALAATDMGE